MLLSCFKTHFEHIFLFVSKAGTACPSRPPVFTPMLSEVRVVRSLVFCVVFCRSLFVLFLLTFVLSVLFWLTASDYPFSIFKLFLCMTETTQVINFARIDVIIFVSIHSPTNINTFEIDLLKYIVLLKKISGCYSK